jgi:hypothetical protein
MKHAPRSHYALIYMQNIKVCKAKSARYMGNAGSIWQDLLGKILNSLRHVTLLLCIKKLMLQITG